MSGTHRSHLFGIIHPKLGKPVKVPLGTLCVQPERFQIRCGESNNAVDATLQEQAAIQAVSAMKEAVEVGKLLDPLIVWEDAAQGALIVIDGHHRMEAYREAEASPSLEVWIQKLNVGSEEEVRKFSYDLNSRVRLNMPQAEKHEAIWKAIVCGEARGSLRAIAHAYGVSKSQVALMKAKSEIVLQELKAEAEKDGVPFNNPYVRARVGLWKSYAEWRDSESSDLRDIDAIRQKKIDSIVRSLSIKFGKQMKARPDDMLEAFAQFHEQATGRPLSFYVQRSGDEFEDEKDEMESDF